jgi:hypothetical protein
MKQVMAKHPQEKHMKNLMVSTLYSGPERHALWQFNSFTFVTHSGKGDVCKPPSISPVLYTCWMNQQEIIAHSKRLLLPEWVTFINWFRVCTPPRAKNCKCNKQSWVAHRHHSWWKSFSDSTKCRMCEHHGFGDCHNSQAYNYHIIQCLLKLCNITVLFHHGGIILIPPWFHASCTLWRCLVDLWYVHFGNCMMEQLGESIVWSLSVSILVNQCFSHEERSMKPICFISSESMFFTW